MQRKIVFVFILLLIVAHPLSAQWLKQLPIAKEEKDVMGGIRAAEEWYWGQRMSGTGHIPEGALSKGIAQRSRLEQMAKAKGSELTVQSLTIPQWKLVGPANIGGRVNAIAVDPKDDNIAYLGAADGGVWKTIDAGATWSPLTDHQVSLAMGALAIDPEQSSTIYAGLGEVPEVVDSYSGYGILKSTDAGANWLNIGPLRVAAFSKIIVHPKNSNTIFAAGAKSGGGIFRTTDAGKSWVQLSGGLPPGEVTDLALAMNGNNPVLYAAIASHGIYRSNDGGDTWTNIHSYTQMRRINLDVAQSDYNTVVAMSIGYGNDLEQLDKTNDGGTSWTPLNISSELFIGPNAEPAQGFYDAYITIDPSDKDHIVIGGISIFASRDGGNSFDDVGQAYRVGGVHPDQHAAAFSPSKPAHVYFGNDGGIVLSDDGGTTIMPNSQPISVTQFYRIGVDQTANALTYGGTQDNGSIKGSTSTDWSEFAGGDGTYAVPDPNTPGRVYWQNPQDYPQRYDNGSSTPITNGILDGELTKTWLKPLVLDSKNNILYFGTSHLYYSLNNGDQWIRTSQQLYEGTDSGAISTIDFVGDKKTVVVGTEAGRVYLTTDQGSTFVDRTTGLPGRWITSVRFSPSSASTIYATLSGFSGGHVFKSVNSGASWINISGTLPDIPVSKILIDPQNSKVLYIATDLGVFISPDDGAHWAPCGSGLPNVAVDDMDFQIRNRVLRAGTHGRSIWEVPLAADLPAIETPSQGTIWVNGNSAQIGWRNLPGPVTLDFSPDGGMTWKPLASNISSSSYSIANVTSDETLNALVRVRNGSDTLVSPRFTIVNQKAGSTIRLVAELPFYAYDVAFDSDLKVLWATAFSPYTSKIFKLDPDNGHILDSISIGKVNLTGIKYDAKRKHLFVHQANESSGSSNFYEISKSGNLIHQHSSPSTFGTGILVVDDTIFFADRTTSEIKKHLVTDNSDMNSITIARTSIYGPRCLARDFKQKDLLLAWTDFQGSDQTNASLSDSYLLRLDPADGTELSGTVIQPAQNQSSNVRGLEVDPRDGGNSAWVTVLNTGNSSQLIKVSLTDTVFHSPDRVAEHNFLGYAQLGQNFPNPFNPSTTIPYTLVHQGTIELRILDQMGRSIFSTGQIFKSAGAHLDHLDLSQLSSGTYYYELRVNGLRVNSKKLTLLK